MSPSRPRALQLETWRGMARAGAGDADGMRGHLERAVTMATEGGRASARCEAVARLALEASRFVGAGGTGASMEEVVEASVAQVKELQPQLPGHAPWGAQADAASATVALARGDVEAAVTAGGAALAALQAGLHEDTNLEVLIPAARALFAGAPPEVQGFVRNYLQSTLSRIAQGTADEAIRVRWLTGPVGRELVALAGPMDGGPFAAGAKASETGADSPSIGPESTWSSLGEDDRRLLRLLTEGRTNAEIAAELDLGENDVAQRLARLQARLGTSSRAEATSLAFRGLAMVGSA